jgi:hypothetical protein
LKGIEENGRECGERERKGKVMSKKLMDPEKRQVQLRLTKDLYRRIGVAAVRYDRSRSALIRDVMGSWLDREDQKAYPMAPRVAAQIVGEVEDKHILARGPEGRRLLAVIEEERAKNGG